MWESDDEADVPASDSKDCSELDQGEHAALADLGVTEEMWGGDTDC